MKVLVTGGAGFIGSRVVDCLVDAGADVRVIDALIGQAHEGTPDYLNNKAEYIVEDLTDERAVARAVSGLDAVSHQASMVGLESSVEDAPTYVKNNDMATAVLLKSLAGAEFRGPLVLASSMVVYGEGQFHCAAHGVVRPQSRSREDLEEGSWEPLCPVCKAELVPVAISEDAICDPRNVYAATKLHQEHLCTIFAKQMGSALVTLRYHNVYGPRMPANTPYAGVASIFRTRIRDGKPALVYEDGNQLRDFIHVADVAAANLQALERPRSGAFNIATGTPKSVIEMATSLTRGARSAAPPPVVTGEFRTGDIRHVFASPSRAADVMGWRARVGFDQGMREFAKETLRGD